MTTPISLRKQSQVQHIEDGPVAIGERTCLHCPSGHVHNIISRLDNQPGREPFTLTALICITCARRIGTEFVVCWKNERETEGDEIAWPIR